MVRHLKQLTKNVLKGYGATSWDPAIHKNHVLKYPVSLTWTQQCWHLVLPGEKFFHLPLKRLLLLRKVRLTESRQEQFWLLWVIFLKLFWKTIKKKATYSLPVDEPWSEHRWGPAVCIPWRWSHPPALRCSAHCLLMTVGSKGNF